MDCLHLLCNEIYDLFYVRVIITMFTQMGRMGNEFENKNKSAPCQHSGSELSLNSALLDISPLDFNATRAKS